MGEFMAKNTENKQIQYRNRFVR